MNRETFVCIFPVPHVLFRVDESLSMRDYPAAPIVVVASLLAMEDADEGSESDTPAVASVLSGPARASRLETRVY